MHGLKNSPLSIVNIFVSKNRHRMFRFLDDSRVKKKRMFRFDNRLRDKEEIFELITDVLRRFPTGLIETKIRHVHSELTNWSREYNQKSAKVIKKAQAALEIALSNDSPDPRAIGQHTAILEKAY